MHCARPSRRLLTIAPCQSPAVELQFHARIRDVPAVGQVPLCGSWPGGMSFCYGAGGKEQKLSVLLTE
jgi:hypothetical protein